jgi:hypothetical protein
MATINRLAIFFLLLRSLVSSEALFAEEVTQSLNPRDANYGGWALSSPSCPADTTSCKSGDNAPSCCPNEYECQYDENTSQHFCCTSGKFPAPFFLQALAACLRIIMGYDRQGRIARRRSKTSPSVRTQVGACTDPQLRVDTSAVWRVKWVFRIAIELDSDLAVLLRAHIQVHC